MKHIYGLSNTHRMTYHKVKNIGSYWLQHNGPGMYLQGFSHYMELHQWLQKYNMQTQPQWRYWSRWTQWNWHRNIGQWRRTTVNEGHIWKENIFRIILSASYHGYIQMETCEVMKQLCSWTLNGMAVSLYVHLCDCAGWIEYEFEYLYDGLRKCMLCCLPPGRIMSIIYVIVIMEYCPSWAFYIAHRGF